MKSFFDRCKQFTVIINGGSGVIFQPMTEEYTYVLTAKHTLYDDPETMKNPIEKNIIKAIDIAIKFIEKYEHDELDIAILKINKIDIETPLKEFEGVLKDERYELYGYPGYKQTESANIEEQIENFEVSISRTSGNVITLNNPKFATINEIKGVSGGGVFREDGELIYLVAIEYEMNAKEGSEATHKRIDAISIEAFDEIIEDNSDELARLCPPFMNDFSLLLENIFLLNGMEEYEKRLVQDRLKKIANNLSNKLKPINIKNKFKLLESNHTENDYSNNELWSMYLEFMVISVFIDLHSPIDTLAIEDIHKKRKFLFIKSNNWKYDKEKILISNFSSLDKEGTVIVCCDGDRTPTSCIINNKTLIDIGNGIMREDFNISQGISPHKDLKFKHIHSIQKQMIDDLDNGNEVFNDANADNIEGIIKNEIDKIFN